MPMPRRAGHGHMRDERSARSSTTRTAWSSVCSPPRSGSVARRSASAARACTPATPPRWPRSPRARPSHSAVPATRWSTGRHPRRASRCAGSSTGRAAGSPRTSTPPCTGTSCTTTGSGISARRAGRRDRGTPGRAATRATRCWRRRARPSPTGASPCTSTRDGTRSSARSPGASAGWGRARRSSTTLRARFGLGVSLHCPLATWLSVDGRAVADWPAAALRRREDGTVIEGAVCIGSRQYLEEAERRMLASCADGVGYLMFDGNWWNGGCWNPDHGHPVPFTMEDQVRACLRPRAAHPRPVPEGPHRDARPDRGRHRPPLHARLLHVRPARAAGTTTGVSS